MPDDRRDEIQTRSAAEILDWALRLDSSDLAEPRPPERRLLVRCSHFAMLACALLRQAGTPARARCGFATYFEPDRNVDHWVTEYWDPNRDHWTMFDAQLDAAQVSGHAIGFDPLELPAGAFVVAGAAWQRCRAGDDDPRRFGIFDMHGLWFIRGNVVRDLAALNKVEMLPWDGWGFMDAGSEQESVAADDQVDAAASCTIEGALADVQAWYQQSGWTVPEVVNSYRADGPPVRVSVPV